MLITAAFAFFFATSALADAGPSYKFHCFVETSSAGPNSVATGRLAEADLSFTAEGGKAVLHRSENATYLVSFGTWDKPAGGLGFTLSIAIGNDRGNIAYSKSTWEMARDKTSIWVGSDLAEPGVETGFFCALR